MTRFADIHTQMVDNVRTAAIADYESRKVERDFAQVRKALAANAATMRAASKTAFAWA